MAGNTVVLKPSGITPLSTLVLVEEGMRAVGFPEDVCLVATGRGDVGSVLVDTCDMIMFTGSTETGKMIAERAAKRLIPVSLELGGKDPMIVLADADLDRAADVARARRPDERRADLHVGRAHLRRGARLRRVRREDHRARARSCASAWPTTRRRSTSAR